MAIAPNTGQKIQVLAPEEARKIAAGEVIDRPAALVREFIDNAIDAGGRLIEVIIEEGGVHLTEVVDDGIGMGKEDLELCWLTHATSKIRTLEDLRSAGTLGFRGEALSAAAAVSSLEILSSRDGREAWKLSVGPGDKHPPLLEQSRRTRGTSIRALGLYDTIPARKRFLKRSGSEANACRQIFNEKALAFPEIAFRFTQDGVLKSFFPPVLSFRERYCQVFLNERECAFLHEIAAIGPSVSGPSAVGPSAVGSSAVGSSAVGPSAVGPSAAGKSFSVSIVAGGPELSRQDRRFQFVFANSRRIQDYSLIQALEYGLQGWFPNGTHPQGAVFVNIDPSLADFNIHPAKREARFADPAVIHQTVTAALRDFCRSKLIKDSSHGGTETQRKDYDFPDSSFLIPHSSFPIPNSSFLIPNSSFLIPNSSGPSGKLALEALLANPPEFTPLPGRNTGFSAEEAAGHTENTESWTAEQISSYPANGIRYLGQLFNLFILVEKGDRLFIIDQHAAHERILYDRFISGSVSKQELLVAIPFTTESPEDDRFLEEKREELAKFGIVLGRNENEWLIEALPSLWKLSDRETVEELLSLKTAGENLAEHWAATAACHAAIKDGDYLDAETALALANKAFGLPVPRCPHGRPIWLEISHNDLLKAVKRS